MSPTPTPPSAAREAGRGTRRQRMNLSREDVALIGAFLKTLRTETYTAGSGWSYRATYPITSQQIEQSYQSWARGGRAWNAMQQGGTGIMVALCWYQHVHRPGSREWRPRIIIGALLEAARAALATLSPEVPR